MESTLSKSSRPMNRMGMSLNRHILEKQRDLPYLAEFAEILSQLGYASKVLAREIRQAAIRGSFGKAGAQNTTGDEQKKLDLIANQALIEAFGDTGLVGGIVSEELEKIKPLACSVSTSKYILCADPLDGSSNTDINGSVGTIFGLYRKKSKGCDHLVEDLIGGGCLPLLSGYVMYGPTTILTYSAGDGVHSFLLDQELGEFILFKEKIIIPKKGKYYSANIGNIESWSIGLKQYCSHVTKNDSAANLPMSYRYTGALIADFHRTLLEGGIYFYPSDPNHPKGKLRLFYECAPLAFLCEQAGGLATNGSKRILDVQATEIHQRVPFFIGSTEDVQTAMGFMR